MNNNIYPARAGWRAQEEELLFNEVEQGRKCSLPLKAVFASVAKKTGRQPNSVRNYYYARIKSDDSLAKNAHCSAFVPFTQEEMRELLRTVLRKQAQGMSVRAITLEMGNGDNREMLRYQNKYRSLIKTNQQLVRSIQDELANAGKEVFDPYAATRRTSKHKSASLVDVVSAVVNDLGNVDGLDVTAFFEGLGALALSASRGVGKNKPDGGITAERMHGICVELREQVRSQQNELCAQRDRFNALLSLHRQLISVNREFLGMTGVTKMSSLSAYIRELSRNVEDCERLLGEYVK
ncbi:MAG: hypothetical protein RR232_03400 [Clostridia bacterium]